ncbi:probable LRR receptor-like serine/threonine-protein kinase At2g16250 [Arachis hypogaea]|uniref:probable LRR receptor-like serine/threonine-protein kinase At2g16250 n=1 Tax=Arachis hypogaea TaxID=3818 RepID=UPI000DECE00D|nr:probable LRR receptor-like serine/threonine-protein kinase At2g16250 [Arachis hypogaea]XP_025640185.1 probable LRR receptor-like serine/threonine-protein kinase At2g16250 [Arachis hypogaea]XP_025640186.1 probable LRR receptor-like serine/threonine-protein kinase At2g16250 [Arachis hypogaea]QHO05094.1 putative LRR receptor-like serine/threonine-protein kinase [Arachis hypogaea]
MKLKKLKSSSVFSATVVFTVMSLFFFVEFSSALSSSTEKLSSRTEWLSLLQLRSSLGIRAKNWPRKTEPCRNWTGIHCKTGSVIGINISGFRRTHKASLHPSFSVDALANFTRLASFNASGFVLNGSIPEWFGDKNNNNYLGALQVLDLSSCSITGSIPESIGGLILLKSVLLSGNSLTGRMPSGLGMLSNLSVLDLSGNELSGSIPDSLFSLGNLTSLNLSSNYLSGNVPNQLSNLSGLETLDLSNNALTGNVPSVLFSRLSKLRVLNLSGNFIDGDLPDTLWSLPSLRFVDVSNNNLTGPLPKFFGSNTSSTDATFNLSNNLFFGTLNISAKKFRMIDLSGNYLEGEVQGVSLSNVGLARNCLEDVPNQRDVSVCRVFYEKRNLPFPSNLTMEKSSRKKLIFILVGVFGGLGFILLLALVLVLFLKLCGNHKSLEVQRGTESGGPVPVGESPVPPKDLAFHIAVGESFTYEQILKLTGNFAEENIIKHGHSGDLFWGVMENGATVVIKRVDLSLFKRESYVVELELLSKVSHARLIPILGHCLENDNEKCIVYKYMPNGDLASSLQRVTDADGKSKSLDWITRLKIATGAAEGLAYLHDCSPPLAHRDVQASSILLDDKFEVRLGSLSEVTTQGDVHPGVMNRLFSKPSSSNQPNFGTSSVTWAGDVYGFGKILLELITGDTEVSKLDDATSREWLEQTLPYISIDDKERINKIVDPSLLVNEDLLEEVWAIAIVARSCLNPRPSKRPPMRHVLRALENPLKVVREESASSVKLRTTSSRKSWSTGLFGSWRQSSSDSATATNKDSSSGTKQSGKVSSQGSGVIMDHSSSNKRSSKSNEVFPEPLETQDVEIGGGR